MIKFIICARDFVRDPLVHIILFSLSRKKFLKLINPVDKLGIKIQLASFLVFSLLVTPPLLFRRGVGVRFNLPNS